MVDPHLLLFPIICLVCLNVDLPFAVEINFVFISFIYNLLQQLFLPLLLLFQSYSILPVATVRKLNEFFFFNGKLQKV